MGVFDTFSRRERRRRSPAQPEVYRYDELPNPFRVQVIHIWGTAIGPFYAPGIYTSFTEIPASNSYWQSIERALAREKGLFCLGKSDSNPFERCQHYLLNEGVEDALDLIDLSFKWIDRVVRQLKDWERQRSNITQSPDEAVEELNARFKMNGVGYQFSGGALVRVDSEYLHAEAVKPALSLLHDAGFRGPSDEFIRAHEHYRQVRFKEAIAEALKSFESTMKSICDQRKWAYAPNATASGLIEVLFSNGLLPPALNSHFGALKALLESGLPTVRNKMAGHGQGKDTVSVPGYIAAYALHLAASNIVLLLEAHNTRQ